MKIIILAAGEGTRLRPFTLKVPKCLVEIDKISILDRQIQVIKSQKLNNIIIVGGYLAHKLVRNDTKLIINDEYSSTNMVWTLFKAELELKGEIIISYGDIVYAPQILKKLIEAKSDIAIAVDLGWENYWSQRFDDPLTDAETLKMSSNGRINEIGKKPNSIFDIQGQYMGIMKFSSLGIEILKKTYSRALKTKYIQNKPIRNAYMTDLIQELIDIGVRVDAITTNKPWVEVDTVSDLKSAITKKRLADINKMLS